MDGWEGDISPARFDRKYEILFCQKLDIVRREFLRTVTDFIPQERANFSPSDDEDCSTSMDRWEKKGKRAIRLNFDYFGAIYLSSNSHLIYHLHDCPPGSILHLDYTLHEF